MESPLDWEISISWVESGGILGFTVLIRGFMRVIQGFALLIQVFTFYTQFRRAGVVSFAAAHDSFGFVLLNDRGAHESIYSRYKKSFWLIE